MKMRWILTKRLEEFDVLSIYSLDALKMVIQLVSDATLDVLHARRSKSLR